MSSLLGGAGERDVGRRKAGRRLDVGGCDRIDEVESSRPRLGRGRGAMISCAGVTDREPAAETEPVRPCGAIALDPERLRDLTGSSIVGGEEEAGGGGGSGCEGGVLKEGGGGGRACDGGGGGGGRPVCGALGGNPDGGGRGGGR